MAADVSSTFSSWSSTESSNSPAGSTNIGANLDDNLRMIQAMVAAWRDGVQWGGLVLSSVAGTNTITGTASPAPTAYVVGMRFGFFAAGTNTGATTLNVSSIGAGAVQLNGSALAGGEITSGQWIEVVASAATPVFQIVNSGGIYPQQPFTDTNPVVVGSSDATKKVRFEVDGLTTATTRVITVSDQNFTIGKQPTRQTFTTGSGTYTTPSGATHINVRLVGGGGSGSTSGANGGNTTFGTLTGSGGSGAGAAGGAGGAGGAASGGDINIAGGNGNGASQNNGASVALSGQPGGNSFFGGGGGAGQAGSSGTAAATNSGAGGGSDGVGTSTNGRPSGGAGGYVEKLIVSPSATYSYAVGAKGGGGTGGQAGADGLIIVDEYYN